MQALGMIETKGLLAAVEATDTMLKASDVTFYEKQKVGSGRITVLVTGDVAAVKAAVEAGVMAVKQIRDDCLLSSHIIPRPDIQTMSIFRRETREETPPVELVIESPVEKEIPKRGKKSKEIKEK